MEKGGLAPLPLPRLSATLDKYLHWVGPLLDEGEFDRTVGLTRAFKEMGGPFLQARLEDLAQQEKGDWLAGLWREMYLKNPQPLPANINYYMEMDLPRVQTKEEAAFQAAGVMLSLLEQYRRIQRGERICPHAPRPTEPSFEKRLFSGVRIPRPGGDQMMFASTAKKAQVVVIHGGRMYQASLTTPQGSPLSQSQLTGQLLAIWSQEVEASCLHPGPMTTADRAKAARFWQGLEKSSTNREAMELLKEALWVLCLEVAPLEQADLSLLAGSGRNRYYDKSLQMIADSRGLVGFNFEHSAVDAGPWLELLAQVERSLTRSAEKNEALSGEPLAPISLDWQLSEHQRMELAEMEGDHEKTTASLFVVPWQWRGYGRKKLKEMGVGADGLFHCALALTQRKTFERLYSTYEAVSMRHYRQGRTECSRPLTWEMLHWLELMETSGLAREIKKTALEGALKKHQARLRACQAGRGIERHLFALEALALKDESGLETAKAFFEDEAYRRLRKDVLSTSAMGSAYLKSFGFGPVTSEGFGLAYDLREDSLFGTLSAWKNQALVDPELFLKNLMKSFEALGDLLDLS